jgi:hypothetical protein
MKREWVPGDVALVKFAWQLSDEPLVCIRAEKDGMLGWLHPGRLGGFTSDCAPAGPVAVLPVVVIDPEDREQVDRLRDLIFRHPQQDVRRDDLGYDETTAALREFANPTPPKPAEPMGRAAVVEDTQGVLWVSWRSGLGEHVRPWERLEMDVEEWRDYADIAVASVRFGGVS